MESNKVQADKYGVLFNLPSSSQYLIAWWQIERDGYTYWLSHLQDKEWFSAEMRREFESLCHRHNDGATTVVLD